MSRTYRPAADDVLGSVQRIMLGANARNETGTYCCISKHLSTNAYNPSIAADAAAQSASLRATEHSSDVDPL